ncbi:hypothetical protein [Shinella sp. BYT-45]|uniref:hypothetical protein n=1 Tax=Shinella sp. BYT-45 TaxID=3377377 RepID=UPI00397F9E6B
MNNQWGRSGNGPAGSGGVGLGGIAFAVLVSLVLGGAAGYGAFRMTDGAAPAGDIEQRDRRIADLAKELDARVAQVEESTRKAQALAGENDALRRQVETLRTDAGASEAASAAAENARLTQEVVPELKNELELASQRLADAEALRKRAEQAVRDRERRLSLNADRIARLEKALDEACSRQGAVRDAEMERLEAEADTLRRDLSQARQAEEAIRTRELPALREEVARKDREIAALNARNASLAARIGALEAAARSAQPGGQTDGGDKPALDNAKPDEGRSPRNAALVAEAMQDTPGLDRLTRAQRDQLERTLVSGECVTNALGGVFTRVPVLTLRNLMRGLDSDC